MGSDAPAGPYSAAPVQTAITVSAFAMDAYEVTVGRFRRYWDAGMPGPQGPIMYPRGPLGASAVICFSAKPALASS